MKILISLLLLSTGLKASIFGPDNRIDYYQMSDSHQDLSEASIALIPKDKLEKRGDYFYPKTKTLQKQIGFCGNEKFAKQLQLANCSASLIGEDILLTAGHCIDKKAPRDKNFFYAVFNYRNKETPIETYRFHKSDVLILEKELFHNYDETFRDLVDLAVYKLSDKVEYKTAKVSTKPPQKNDEVFILGYPLGISLKLSDDSLVTMAKPEVYSFRHHLDTFSVNSGSPVFNNSGEIVGVHVRGTGRNFVKKKKKKCYRWQKGDPIIDYGEANDLRPLSNLFKRLNILQ